MSFPTSSPPPAWVPSPTSSTASIPVASPPVFDEYPSSYEPPDSPIPQFDFETYSPSDMNMDRIMNEGYSDRTVVIDYHEIRQQVSPPSDVSNALVIYEQPDIRNPANLHEELRKAVTDAVRKEVKELMKQAKQEKGKQKEQKEDVTESTNESGTPTIQKASKNSPDLHESPKNVTNTGGSSSTKRARTASKEVAHLFNVSFQIPEDFEVNSDIVNEFVPEEEVLRETTTRNRKKYSFSDRLRGWDMECRMRLYDGIHQLDKYFTHVQSNITVRSVPEVVSFILYEVNPKQTKEANRKRKSINPPGSCILQDPAEDEGRQTMLKDEDVDPFEQKYEDMLRGSHDDEKWVEMYLRVSQDNYTFRTSVDVPSDVEWDAWKERKAAKKKAKTTPSSPQAAAAGPSNADVEVIASTLISLAETRQFNED